jgi:hypothetical protein
MQGQVLSECLEARLFANDKNEPSEQTNDELKTSDKNLLLYLALEVFIAILLIVFLA